MTKPDGETTLDQSTMLLNRLCAARSAIPTQVRLRVLITCIITPVFSADCVAWTWHRDQDRCYLKGKQGEYKPCNACISGDKTVQPFISISPAFAQ